MKSDLIDVEVCIRHETDAAVLVYGGAHHGAVWLPKSQIEIEPSGVDPKTLTPLAIVTVPEWLAIEKGLV